jgi:hypothetical protein
VWLRERTFDGSEWVVTSDPEWYRADPPDQCRAAPEDEIAEEDVRQAGVEFGLPAADLEMNPIGARTLINIDSIFYAQAGPAEFTLAVGSTNVEIRATPGSPSY